MTRLRDITVDDFVAHLGAVRAERDRRLRSQPMMVHEAARVVAAYAVDGVRHPEIDDAIYGLRVALLTRAVDTAPTGTVDPDSMLGVVLHAADGRRALERGDGLTRMQLAALAGVQARSLHGLAITGDAPTSIARGHYARQECVAWLRSRGVPGI